MSGGVAYVLDEDGTFAARCNMGMVGFEALEPTATPASCARWSRSTPQRTGSPVAARVLDDWDELLARARS